MDTKNKKRSIRSQKEGVVRRNGRSASERLAKKGMQSAEDFRNLMGALMTDVVKGDIAPDVVNAACNAGRGLLRMVEFEYKASNGKSRAMAGAPAMRRIASA